MKKGGGILSIYSFLGTEKWDIPSLFARRTCSRSGTREGLEKRSLYLTGYPSSSWVPMKKA